MNLMDFYKSLLRFTGYVIDSKGYISIQLDDNKRPAVVNNVQLVMPYPEQLRDFNPEEKMIFHPLTENIVREESQIIRYVKQHLNVRLNYSISAIGTGLLKILTSPELHSKLNPEQQELLTVISDCDVKTVTNFVSLALHGMKEKPESYFTNIYIKRGGLYQSQKYSRVGIVTFAFYEELKSDKAKELKARVKDIDAYQKLFRYIFPDIDTNESYNHPSDSHLAPNLEALYKTAAKMAARLNDLTILFEEFLDRPDSLLFDLDWYDHCPVFDKLENEVRKIPVQQGNEGDIQIASPVPSPVQTTAMVQAPIQQQMPVQPMQQPMQPVVKRTERGLDFKSMVMNNPYIASSGCALPRDLQIQAMQQNMQQPPSMPVGYPGYPYPQQQQIPQQQMIQTPQGPMPVVQTPQGPMIMTPNGYMPLQQMMPNQMQYPNTYVDQNAWNPNNYR